MPGGRWTALRDWVVHAVTYPGQELSRFQRTLRFCYDLGRYGYNQLQHDRAPQMAGALAFRTLFALLPVLVVGTIVVRAFRGFEGLQVRLEAWFHTWHLDQYRLASAPSADGSVQPGESISDWLLGLVSNVEKINLAAIGWVGLAVVIYAAIGLMITVEKSFNIIYRAPEGRSWVRRLTVYWTVLTLSPAAIALTMYMGSTLGTAFDQQTGWLSLFRAAPVLWNYLATLLVIFALYKLIPNTTVGYRPALIGAFVAAVGTEIGKETMGWYFTRAVSFGQLYGSLGLIPLFMLWVYVMWVLLLFGLEVSATLQALGGRRLEEFRAKQANDMVDPASVLLVMEVVAARFGSSESTSARQVADETQLPERAIVRMFERLVEAGMLHWLDRDESSVTLSRPPDQIAADELIEVGFGLVDESWGDHKPALLERLREAQRSLAQKVTLDAMTTPSPTPAAPEAPAKEKKTPKWAAAVLKK